MLKLKNSIFQSDKKGILFLRWVNYNKKKILSMRFAVIFFLSLILSASSLEAKEELQDKGCYGGRLTWGVAYKPTIINPILTTGSVSASLQGLIFNELIRLNAKGEIEPDLALYWSISSDGLIYTFHLRKGIKFHDGVECTAEDVKFTFDKIIDPQVNSPLRHLFNLVSEFKVIDKYMFRVILTKPSSSFIYRLIKPIAPKHLLENTDLRSASFNFKPVGTGPFKFKEWGKDGQITLEYNPDYYEGRPYLDEIIVRQYPGSLKLWQALMRQEIDLVLFIDKQDYKIIEKDPAFKSYAVAVDYYYAVSYNLNDQIFADLKIREAVASALNRKLLMEKVSLGYGLECNGPFYPDSIGFNPQVKPIEFNPEKARRLLVESGWQDLNKDGILEKDGKDFEIRMLVDMRIEEHHRIAMVLRQQLQEFGIKLTVLLYNDDSELTSEYLAQNKPQAQLKLLPAGIDPDQTDAVWFSQSPEKIYSLWEYLNPQVDELFISGKTAKSKAERKQIYQEIYKVIYANQPVCFLYFPCYFHAVSSRVKNADELFTLSMPYEIMRKWFIVENQGEKGGEGEWRLLKKGQM